MQKTRCNDIGKQHKFNDPNECLIAKNLEARSSSVRYLSNSRGI